MRIKYIPAEDYSYLTNDGTVIFLLCILTIITALYFSKHHNRRKLPPGPLGLPIFGYYPFLGKNPTEKLSDIAKKYGNVFGFYLGPQYVVVINDWIAVKEALSQSSSLDRPLSAFDKVPFNFGFVGVNGPEWNQLRRVFSRAIKDIGLNRNGWEDLLKEQALDLVHRIAMEGGRPVEVQKYVADSFTNNMLTLILGERLPVGHPLTKVTTNSVDAIIEDTPTLGIMNFSPILSKFLQALGLEKEYVLIEKMNLFGKFVSDTVDERIRNPVKGAEESFIGRFQEEIENHRKDKESSFFTENSLKGNVIALLTGGSETTRTTFIWLLIAMANHPEIQRKVHEELDEVIGKNGFIMWKDRFKLPYTFATFLESMRWTTVVPINTIRMASEDMQVQGYHIPKGTFITANNWSLHNDPKYWENPEQFVPERFLLESGKKVNMLPESFNPFSYGKRNCPGKLLAVMAGMLYFIILLQKFEVKPKVGEKVKHNTFLGLTYQATDVQLRFIPR